MNKKKKKKLKGTIPWDLGLRTEPTTKGQQNKLYTIPELELTESFWARGPHQTCLNARTYLSIMLEQRKELWP